MDRRETSRVVNVLESLASGHPLNPWFRQIVEQGTGRAFKQDDNADWTRITSPILEAFFHARFFLEMAVRYATLLEPPRRYRAGTLRFFACMASADSRKTSNLLRALPT